MRGVVTDNTWLLVHRGGVCKLKRLCWIWHLRRRLKLVWEKSLIRTLEIIVPIVSRKIRTRLLVSVRVTSYLLAIEHRLVIIHRAVMVGVGIASTATDTAVSLSTIVVDVSAGLVGWEEISSKFGGVGLWTARVSSAIVIIATVVWANSIHFGLPFLSLNISCQSEGQFF